MQEKRANIALSGLRIDKTTYYASQISEDYLRSIWLSGGSASALYCDACEDYINEACRHFDGFVFCGGGDIDPKYYGEKKAYEIENICSLRDAFEQQLFYTAYKSKKPILGICRGMQVINVFLGGSLHQSICNHSQTEPRRISTHSVSIRVGTPLHSIIGSGEAAVNSFHHQAVKVLAPALETDAVSDSDSLIEAFHDKGHKFCLGVQWHPESMYLNDMYARSIFDSFVKACK